MKKGYAFPIAIIAAFVVGATLGNLMPIETEETKEPGITGEITPERVAVIDNATGWAVLELLPVGNNVQLVLMQNEQEKNTYLLTALEGKLVFKDGTLILTTKKKEP